MATTLVCRIEMAKKDGKGIVVTVEKEGKILQTMQMDGTTITTTVKNAAKGGKEITTITHDKDHVEIKSVGKKGESTYFQDPLNIRAKVKNFKVDAEKIEMLSSKDSIHTAEGKYTVKSTKAMAFTSSNTYTLKSTKAMTLQSSNTFTAKSVKAMTLKGLKIAATGSTGVAIKGGPKAEISAAQVIGKGTAKAQFAAPMTEIGKMMTQIKGTMVMVKGSMNMVG